jgi:putative methionine-R-sulfoxide reductase with GAF domain
MRPNIITIQNRARKILHSPLWQEHIHGFIDILHINIAIVDEYDNLILPPVKNKYGETLLTDQSLGFDLLVNTPPIMDKFKPQGFFFESSNRFNLHSFALPIELHNYTIGYLIIGPVILNKQLDIAECQKLAKQYGLAHNGYLNELSELRVVSNIMMNAILKTLAQEIRLLVELNLYKIRKSHKKAAGPGKTGSIKAHYRHALQDADHLSQLILTLAMNIADTECGSFMTVDDKKQTLHLSAYKGLDADKMRGISTQIGEGIAGIAAQEGTAYYIKGQKGPNNRLRPLLQRPEIKQSLIMPIQIQNDLFGVLNLHTKKDTSQLVKKRKNLDYISQVLSSI